MALRVEHGEQEEELAGDLADQAGDEHRQVDDADTIDGLLAEDDGRQEEEDDQQQHDLQDEESVQNGSTPPAEEAQAQGRAGRAMPAAYYMDAADMGGPEPPSQSHDSSGQHASHSGQQGHEYQQQQQRYDRGHEHNGGRMGGYGRGRGAYMGHDSRQGYGGRGNQYGSRPGGWRPPEGHMGNMPPTGGAGVPHMMAPQHMMSGMHQGPGHRPPGAPVPPPRPPAGPPPSTSSQSSAKPPANLGMPSILRPGLPQEPSNGTATLPPTPSAHTNGQSLGLLPGPKPPPHMMPPLLLPGHPPPLLMMPAITPGMGMHNAGWRPPGVPGPWGPQHAGVTSPRDVSPAAAAAAGWQGAQPWAVGPFAAPVGPRPNKWVRPGATVPATTAAAPDTPAEPAESKEAELQRKLAIIEANKKQQEERRRKAAAAAAAGAAEPEAVSTAAPSTISKPAAAATPAALLKAHEEYIENLRRMIALQEAAVKGSDPSAVPQGTGGEATDRQGVKRAGSRSLSPSLGSAGAAAALPVKRARRVQRTFSTAASTGTDKSTLDAGDGLQFCEETEQGSQTAQPPVNGTHDELDVVAEFVLGQQPAMDEDDLGLGT